MTVSSVGPLALSLGTLHDPATQQGLFKAPGRRGGWGAESGSSERSPLLVLARGGQEEGQLCPGGLGAWNPEVCPWCLGQFPLKEMTPWVSL